MNDLEKIRAKLGKMEQNTKNIKPLLDEIGNLITNEAELSFEREQSPSEKKWKPLSQKTLAKKKGSKILTESARLQSSIKSRTTQDSIIIGTNVKYAAIHQFGGRAGRNKSVFIPARPYLPFQKNGEISDGVKKDIQRLVKSYLMGIK